MSIARLTFLLCVAGCGVSPARQAHEAGLTELLARFETICDRATAEKDLALRIDDGAVRDAFLQEWDSVLLTALPARVAVALLFLKPYDGSDPQVEHWEVLGNVLARRVEFPYRAPPAR